MNMSSTDTVNSFRLLDKDISPERMIGVNIFIPLTVVCVANKDCMAPYTVMSLLN